MTNIHSRGPLELFFLASLLGRLVVCNTCTLKIEGERSAGQHIPRSMASNLRTLRLEEGEEMNVEFSLTEMCKINIDDCRYSNDEAESGGDILTFHFGDLFLGSFKTKAQSNYGHNWNKFESSGVIGDQTLLHPGEYAIIVVGESVDYHGVEIDYVTLRVDCPNHTILENACPSSLISFDSNTASDDQSQEDSGDDANSGNACSLKIEGEQSAGQHMQRSMASDEMTLRLEEGEEMNVRFSLTEMCKINIDDCRYSNDEAESGGDILTFHFGDVFLGSFKTKAQSNYGHNWNKFESSGVIGNQTLLRPGEYAIIVVGESVDYHGVEIDYVTLRIDCPNRTILENACPSSLISFDSNSASDDQSLEGSGDDANSGNACSLKIEGEQSAGQHMQRSMASDEMTLRLEEGEEMNVGFSLTEMCKININDCRYSNDEAENGGDILTFHFGDVFLGSFKTKAQSNYGHNWNKFESSGVIGNQTLLHPGKYSIIVVGESVDYHGVEIDYVTLRVDCPNRTILHNACPSSLIYFSTNSASDDQSLEDSSDDATTDDANSNSSNINRIAVASIIGSLVAAGTFQCIWLF